MARRGSDEAGRLNMQMRRASTQLEDEMRDMSDLFADADGMAPVCYGDLVTLHVSADDGFMAAEGILDNSSEVRVLPHHFEDCVFTVLPRNRMSAARELRDYQAAKADRIAVNGADSEPSDEDDGYLMTLRRVALKERTLNEQLTERYNGTPVKFGDSVLLKHNRSEKFVTVNKEIVAELERENMRVELDATGAPNSLLNVHPVSSIHSEGDELRNMSDVLLEVEEHPGEFVHCSSAKMLRPHYKPIAGVHATAPEIREFNCSLDQTPWKVCLYSRYQAERKGDEAKESEAVDDEPASETEKVGQEPILRGGELIYLHDPETHTYLRLLSEVERSHVDEAAAHAARSRAQKAEIAAQVRAVAGGNERSMRSSMRRSRRTSTVQELEAAAALKAQGVDTSSAFFQPTDPGAQVHAGAIWRVEQVRPQVGGNLQWEEEYVLRHLLTGQFLCAVGVEKSAQSPSKAAVAAEHHEKLKKMLSRIGAKDVDDDDDYDGQAPLHFSGSVVRLPLIMSSFKVLRTEGEVGGHNVHARQPAIIGIESEDEMPKYLAFGPRVAGLGEVGKNHGASNHGMHVASGVSDRKLAIPLMLERVPHHVVADVQFCSAIRPWLMEYNRALHNVDSGRHEELFPRVLRGIEALSQFATGEHVTEAAEQAEIVVGEGKGKEDQLAAERAQQYGAPVSERQQMLREYGIIDLLLDLLEASSALIESARSQVSNDAAKRTLKLLAALCKVTLRATHQAIAHNPQNQVHVADRFPVLISFLGSGATAMRCVTELLHNVEIQENKVTQREVNLFIGMLRAGGMNHTLMKVLGSLCAVEDVGIDSNQTLLVTLLLLASQELLIQFFIGKRGVPPEQAIKSAQDHCIKAMSGFEEGLQELAGELLCHCPGEQNSTPLYTIHSATLRYLIAQIQTFAQMCFDRNYIAISVLAKRAPLPTLLRALEMKGEQELHPDLRAAILQLIGTLHVDVKPQEEFLVNNLSCLWDTLAAGGDVSRELVLPTPTEAPADPHLDLEGQRCARRLQKAKERNYSRIKQLISDHLNVSLLPENWSDFTLQATALLLQLVRFKFYTAHEVQIASASLLAVLAAHRGDVHGNDDDDSETPVPLKDLANRSTRKIVPDDGHTDGGDDATVKTEEEAIRLMDEIATPDAMRAARSITAAIPEDGATKASGVPAEKTLDHAVLARQPTVVPRKVKRKVRSRLQIRTLELLDTIPCMVFIMILVFASIALSMVENLIGKEGDERPAGFYLFDVISLLIFALETSLRFWSMSNPRAFFTDIFCVIDFTVVLLAIVVLAAKDALGSAGGFSSALRIVRLLRLSRVLRAAKVMRERENNVVKKVVKEWVAPSRFSSTSPNALLTMLKMIETLTEIQEMGHALRLSALLENLRIYHDDNGSQDESDGDARALRRLLESAMRKCWPLELGAAARALRKQGHGLANLNSQLWDSTEAASDNPDTDAVNVVLVDLLMYEDDDVAFAAVKLLQRFHSPRSHLLDDLSQVQVLQGGGEKLFELFRMQLSLVRQHAETQELWGGLETDEHRGVAMELKKMLRLITARCSRPSEALVSGSLVVSSNTEADVEAQTMLRSLNAVEVAMIVYQLSSELREAMAAIESEKAAAGGALMDDMEEDEETSTTREILRLTSKFMVGFVHCNQENQGILNAAAFDQLVEMLPLDVGVADVLYELLHNNERLINALPDSFVPSVMKRIVDKPDSDQVPGLLKLLSVMTHLNVQGSEIGLYNFQVNVVRQLLTLHRETVQKWLPGNEDSIKYKNMMAQLHQLVTGTAEGGGSVMKDMTAMQMPLELSRTCQLMETLTGCAVGLINIVEAMIQSYCPYDELLSLLLERNVQACPQLFLTACRFFFDVMVDVKIMVPGLAQSKKMWTFLALFPRRLEDAFHAVEDLERLGAASVHGSGARFSLKLTFVGLVPTVIYFFRNYFKQEEVNAGGLPVETIAVHDLSRDIYMHLIALYEKSSYVLPAEYQEMCHEAITQLHKSVGEHVLGRAPPAQETEAHEKVKEKRRQDRAADTRARQQQAAAERSKEFTGVEGADMVAIQGDGMVDSTVSGKTLEVRACLARYASRLRASTAVKKDLAEEEVSLVKFLNQLPMHEHESAPNEVVRYEAVLRRLIGLIDAHLKPDAWGTKMTLSAEHTELATWLIKMFRSMIEYKWGFSIDERDDEGDDESDEAVEPVQLALDKAGATALCLRLISRGVNKKLVMEAVKLLVALLYKEGGHTAVQTTIHQRLSSPGSSFFFEAVNDELKRITSWHELNEADDPSVLLTTDDNEADDDDKEGAAQADQSKTADNDDGDDSDDDDDDDVPECDGLIIVRFLQLCCEGHYEPNQEILHMQPQNATSTNLLMTMVQHVIAISRLPGCRAHTNSLISFLDTILEVIQGPCQANQTFFALDTELIETMNTLMRRRIERDCDEEEEEEAKSILLGIFMALLERQQNPSNVYNRIIATIHLDALQALAMPKDFNISHDTEMSDTQVGSLVLVEMLENYAPEISEQMHMPEELRQQMLSQVASIEVVWTVHDGPGKGTEVVRRFFAVPPMAKNVPGPVRDMVLENVDISNMESKLLNLISMTKDVYIELNHNHWLAEQGMSKVFSRTVQNGVTWVAFWLAFAVNLMILWQHRHITIYLPSTTARPNATVAQIMSTEENCTAMQTTYASHFGPDWRNQERTDGSDWPDFSSCTDWSNDLLMTLKILQIVVAVFVLVLFVVVRAPVNFRVAVRDGSTQFWAAFRAATDKFVLYYIYYLTLTIVGYKSYLATSFLLLDIIVKNSTTRDVLKAVSLPARQLFATTLLALFVMYIFAFSIFVWFRDDMPRSGLGADASEGECSTLYGCLQTTIGFGMRKSGGIGDYMTWEGDEWSPPWMSWNSSFADDDLASTERIRKSLGGRFYLDLLFFFIVLIVLLNIIFGIIIDTFSELRTSKKHRVHETTTNCFICGIDKNTFDRAADNIAAGFRRHIVEDHSMWNYMRFIIYIWEQDQDDDDGLEFYVRACLERDDLTWFPINQAQCLKDSTALVKDKDEIMADAVSDIEGRISFMKNMSSDRLHKVDKTVQGMVEKVKNVVQVATGPGKRNSFRNSVNKLRESQSRKNSASDIFASAIAQAREEATSAGDPLSSGKGSSSVEL